MPNGRLVPQYLHKLRGVAQVELTLDLDPYAAISDEDRADRKTVWLRTRHAIGFR